MQSVLFEKSAATQLFIALVLLRERIDHLVHMLCKFYNFLVQELRKWFAIVIRDKPQTGCIAWDDLPPQHLEIQAYYACLVQSAFCLCFDRLRSTSSRYEECGSNRAAFLEKDQRYLASGRVSGRVGGLTAALLLRDVRGDRVAILGKAFVRGLCLGRNRSERGVFRNRRG
jgi:hypothetical protein